MFSASSLPSQSVHGSWSSPSRQVPNVASEVKAGRSSVSDCGLCLRVSVSSILDQGSDREIERGTREELTTLRGPFRALEGEDPTKSDDVTNDQLSALAALTEVGITP